MKKSFSQNPGMKKKTARYRFAVMPTVAMLVLTSCAGLPDRQPLEQPGPEAIHVPGRPVTAVFIVRHAEPDYTQSCDPNDCAPAPGTDCPRNPCLSQAGKTRAKELQHVLIKAGIQAIFTTDTHRTRETAEPLRQALQCPLIQYNSPADLIARIRTDHLGQRLLVVSHSTMIESFITQFTAGSSAPPLPPQHVCKINGEFDNLCVVFYSMYGTRVINLQYGTWTDY